MQEICKVEQHISPKNDLMQTITNELIKGQEAANQMRSFISSDGRLGFKAEDQMALNHHSLVTLNSFEAVLSMIKSSDDLIKKRKFDVESSSHDDHHCKSEEICGGSSPVSKERRGCYKRRRTGQTQVIEVTNLTDDGHAWRKYGQKTILKTAYPRNYYRCTHKHDQGCNATKQVQQLSENPTKYQLIYHGHHTCKSLLKTSSIILDDSLEENSSFFVSFEKNNHPTTLAKHTLNPSSMFPASAFYTTTTTTPTPAMVKQEYTTSIKVESSASASASASGSGSAITGAHNHYTSPSSDITSIGGLPSTPVSEQSDVISSSPMAEFYSSATSPCAIDEFEDNLINLFAFDHHQCDPLLDELWANYEMN